MRVEYLTELPERAKKNNKYLYAIKPIINEDQQIVSLSFDTKKEVDTAYNSIRVYLKRNDLTDKIFTTRRETTLYVFRQ